MNLVVSIIGCDGLDGETGMGHFKWQYTRPHAKSKSGLYTYSTDSKYSANKFCKEFGLPLPTRCGEMFEKTITEGSQA